MSHFQSMAVSVQLVALLLAALPALLHGQMLNFLVVGDWGGQEISPYTSPGEIAAAAGMASVSTALNAKFILGLGDNMYHSGIQGNENNFRFNVTFEDVYRQPSLQIPWYLIAGNHDHAGNVTAQIAYSQHSPRWRFPDYYYSFHQTFNDEKGRRRQVHVVMLDTVLLAGNNDDNEDRFMPPPGPRDPQVAETQWQWLENELSESTADYLWVTGHFPVWSACDHGPTDVLIKRLKPLLVRYNATGYLSGHDHCLEYIDDGEARYVLSGAGVECCYNASNTDLCPKDSIKFLVAGDQPSGGMQSGFVSVRMSGASATAVYHREDGRVLFITPPFYPRTSARARRQGRA